MTTYTETYHSAAELVSFLFPEGEDFLPYRKEYCVDEWESIISSLPGENWSIFDRESEKEDGNAQEIAYDLLEALALRADEVFPTRKIWKSSDSGDYVGVTLLIDHGMILVSIYLGECPGPSIGGTMTYLLCRDVGRHDDVQVLSLIGTPAALKILEQYRKFDEDMKKIDEDMKKFDDSIK